MSLKEVIETLHDLFATDKVNVDAVKRVLDSYTPDSEEWEKFAYFSPHK